MTKRWILAGGLTVALGSSGCDGGSSGGSQPPGPAPGGGSPLRTQACKLVPDATLVELLGVPVSEARMDASRRDVCSWVGGTTVFTVIVNYEGIGGAEGFDESRKVVEASFGPTKDLAGVGERAYIFSHKVAATMTTIQIGATQGKALVALSLAGMGLDEQADGGKVARATKRVLDAIK